MSEAELDGRTEYVDLLVDLNDARIAWKPLHEALEELDTAGYVPHRFHEVPERELARVEEALGATYGVALHRGGGWIIERKGDGSSVAGCAGYRCDGETAIAGPFSLDGDLAVHRMTIFLGTLFSLRERGYRQATVPHVKASALPYLLPLLGGSIMEQTPYRRPSKPRVVVCASGNGSNFQALIDAVAAGSLALDIVRLVVNRQACYALERATRAGIEACAVVWDRTCETRVAFDDRVTAAVAQAQPDLVLLLGWMHLLPAAFVARFPDLFNIHPAYLPLDPGADTVVLPNGTMQPAFRGAHAVDDALTAHAQWIGASFHRVTELIDRGDILGRMPLALLRDEARQTINERLHALEHRVMLESLAGYPAMKRQTVT